MKELWLSRGKTVQEYKLWEGRPSKDGEGDYWGNSYLDRFCPREFHKLTTGVRLRPGQCIEIKEIRFIPKKEKK